MVLSTLTYVEYHQIQLFQSSRLLVDVTPLQVDVFIVREAGSSQFADIAHQSGRETNKSSLFQSLRKHDSFIGILPLLNRSLE